MIELPLADLDDDALHWSRVALLARVYESERANLDDEPDCWRCAMRNGFPPGEAFALTPDAIRHLRDNPAPAH